jgi:hypothetical protein
MVGEEPEVEMSEQEEGGGDTGGATTDTSRRLKFNQF